jgi:hypothetical protein
MAVSDLLDSLCAYFDDELERQENVLALTRAQGRAARFYDLEALEAHTKALELLIQDAVAAEAVRLKLVRELVVELGLPLERHTLGGLVDAAPEPWKSRMRDFQCRMRDLVRENRTASTENRVLLRRGLRVVNDALTSIIRCLTTAESAYTANGVETSARTIAAGLIDERS